MDQIEPSNFTISENIEDIAIGIPIRIVLHILMEDISDQFFYLSNEYKLNIKYNRFSFTLLWYCIDI